MIKRLFSIFFILLITLSLSGTCFAHKITLFGYVDQGMVKTESKFSGGRAAIHCQLSMVSELEPVFIGETDEKGMLDFPIPEDKNGFDLIITCGDGHRGTWRIESDELLGTTPVQNDDHAHPVVSTAVPATDDLRVMIREELDAELAPIKRQLAELRQDTVSLADIMGGLGYFLGLAGLASYMRFRKERR